MGLGDAFWELLKCQHIAQEKADLSLSQMLLAFHFLFPLFLSFSCSLSNSSLGFEIPETVGQHFHQHSVLQHLCFAHICPCQLHKLQYSHLHHSKSFLVQRGLRNCQKEKKNLYFSQQCPGEVTLRSCTQGSYIPP